jgi:hypothetical protein
MVYNGGFVAGVVLTFVSKGIVTPRLTGNITAMIVLFAMVQYL